MRGLLRRPPFCTALVVLGGAGLWWMVTEIGDDRISSLLAGVALAACLYICLGPLQFSLLSPPVLYLCVFALFHLGMAVPWALGFDGGPLPSWFMTNRLTPALGLVEVAIAAYLAGILFTHGRAKWGVPCTSGHGIQRTCAGHEARYRMAGVEAAAPLPCKNQSLFLCGVVVYLAGSAMFFLGIESLGGMRFFDAGYAESYRLAAQFDPRLFGTSFTIIPIGLYLAAAGFPRRAVLLVVALTLAWAGGIFCLGFRGFALIPGLVVLSVMEARGWRIPKWAQALLLIAVLAAIPLARTVRDQGIRQRSWDWPELRLLDGAIEMGGSLRPLVHTIHYMQSEPWRWGRTYWRSLAVVWPNLGRRWSGAPYIALEELPPNHWLTLQAEPDMYRRYGGLGFSAVAEPYMNFGVPGVVVYFWGLGALLARAAPFRSTRPAMLAAWAVVLGPLLWTTRNSFEIFFRPALWGLAILAAARFGFALVSGQPEPAGTARPGLTRWRANLRRGTDCHAPAASRYAHLDS